MNPTLASLQPIGAHLAPLIPTFSHLIALYNGKDPSQRKVGNFSFGDSHLGERPTEGSSNEKAWLYPNQQVKPLSLTSLELLKRGPVSIGHTQKTPEDGWSRKPCAN